MNYICNYALAKKESLTLAKLPGLTLPTFLPINMVSEFSLIYVIMEEALSGLDQRVLTLTHHMGEEEEAPPFCRACLLAGLLTYFLGSVKASQLDHRSCMNRNVLFPSVKPSQLDHRCWPSLLYEQKSRFPLTKTIAVGPSQLSEQKRSNLLGKSIAVGPSLLAIALPV